MKNLVLIIGLLIISTTTFAKNYNISNDLNKSKVLCYTHEDFGSITIQPFYFDSVSNQVEIFFHRSTLVDSIIGIDGLYMNTEYRIINNNIEFVIIEEKPELNASISIAHISRKHLEVYYNDMVITFKRTTDFPE